MPLREDIKCERHFYARLSLIHDNGIDKPSYILKSFRTTRTFGGWLKMIYLDPLNSTREYLERFSVSQAGSGRLPIS